MREQHIFYLFENEKRILINTIKRILKIYENKGCGEIVYYDPKSSLDDAMKLFNNNNIYYSLFTQRKEFSKTKFSKYIEDLYRGDIFDDPYNIPPIFIIINNIDLDRDTIDYFENYKAIIEIMNIFVFVMRKEE